MTQTQQRIRESKPDGGGGKRGGHHNHKPSTETIPAKGGQGAKAGASVTSRRNKEGNRNSSCIRKQEAPCNSRRLSDTLHSPKSEDQSSSLVYVYSQSVSQSVVGLDLVIHNHHHRSSLSNPFAQRWLMLLLHHSNKQ